MRNKYTYFGKFYESTEGMIEAAVNFGFRHCGGRGFLCKHCKDKASARKFVLGNAQVYACNKCGARW